MASRGKELKYEIINQIGTVSTTSSGWSIELNRISWNGNEPKYDLRSWSQDHTWMGKGITLTESEIITLSDILNAEVAFLKGE